MINRLRAKLESTSLKVTDENIKLLKQSTSPRDPNLSITELINEKYKLNGSHTMSPAAPQKRPPTGSALRSSRKVAMNAAATKIQV